MTRKYTRPLPHNVFADDCWKGIIRKDGTLDEKKFNTELFSNGINAREAKKLMNLKEKLRDE